MKFLYFAILAYAVLARANGRVQGKRGVAGYTAPIAAAPAYISASNPVTYSRSVQPALEQRTASAAQQYVSQPAAYSAPVAQQYYQAEPQAVAYSQPAASKYAAATAVEKTVLVQPRRRLQPYSSAADVSSFSYNSPLVAYNNLGFLHQVTGKNPASAQVATQAASQAAAPYTAASQAGKFEYAAASNYPSDSNAFDTPGAYQAISQKSAYSQVPQAQAQAITYQSSPANQKISYQTIPGYQAQQGHNVAPQVAYSASPSQQFVYQTPQAANAQAYEAVSHSAPQVVYSQPAPQSQYYSVAQQPKYAQPGITYSQ